MDALEAKQRADAFHKENDDDIDDILENIAKDSSEGSYLICWFDELNKFQIEKLKKLKFKVELHNPKFKHPHYTIDWNIRK